MRILRFIGLGLAAVGVTGGVAFAARVLRDSARCPDCAGRLAIDAFEVVGEEPNLTTRTVARCPRCDQTFVSKGGSPWAPDDAIVDM